MSPGYSSLLPRVAGEPSHSKLWVQLQPGTARSCNAIFTKLDLNTVKFINLEVRGKTVFRARHVSVLAQDPSVGAGRAPAAELQGHGEEVRSCFHSEVLGAGTSGNAG